MIKLLFLALVVIAAYRLFAGALRPSRNRGRPVNEDMVRCAHCGVHVPRSESISGDGDFFCSEEHSRLHH